MLTMKDAYKIKQPIVYGLCSALDGEIKYVGKTINPSKRMQPYFYKKKFGNRRLKKWLYETGDNLRFVVLELNPKNLSDAEIYWIHKLQGQTFNIDMGDGIRKPTEKMPWMAGISVKCPSDLLTLFLNNRKTHRDIIETVNSIKKSMTPEDRMLFELSLAKKYENHVRFSRHINKWLDIVSYDLLKGARHGC